MLFIFRKLRRSFFLPGKVRTYCAYAAGEIVLIVVGILLALQISEWNQEREDRAEETGLLLQLRSELESNKTHLETVTETYQEVTINMNAFLEIIEPQPISYHDDLIFGYLGSQRVERLYVPTMSVITSLISSGKMGLIRNETLRIQLTGWPRSVNQIDYQIGKMIANMARYPSDQELFQTKDVALGVTPHGNPDGSSQFPFDQKKLLSSPITENMAETKLEWTSLVLANLQRLNESLDNILTLIDTELAERGITDSL